MDEQSFKEAFAKRLLQELLGKYERSGGFLGGGEAQLVTRAKRPQLSLQVDPFGEDYGDEMDFRKKEWMNETVVELERRGVLTLVWQRYREGQDVAKVYLMPEAVHKAYSLADVTPKNEKTERMLRLLKPLEEHPWEWVRSWFEKIAAALSGRKSGGLDLDDPQRASDLASVLCALPGLDADVPKRLFSLSMFGDTKYFERNVESSLLSLLRQHYFSEGMERDEELLESVGIVQNPAFVYVCGPLQLIVNDRATETGTLPGGIALSQETIRRIVRMEIAGAARIVTIENLTSYHQWITRHADRQDLLTVYTGGFPSRTAQQFFAKLSKAAFLADIPVFHWGDMDVGGIRIFEYMRHQYFPKLTPLYMNEEIFLRYSDRGIPVSASYLAKIATLADDASYGEWAGLLRLMEHMQIRIEQENVVPD
ncbi:Wadjet anti-phage system protein JetD domain-containing protein [Cohnella soli]|uniref:Wadjet anti-phage system protein JetD domain-containing protein n=1 Tax=Cohnella soli TaxID=425005 RepID=A0ABW0HT84_9BACL